MGTGAKRLKFQHFIRDLDEVLHASIAAMGLRPRFIILEFYHLTRGVDRFSHLPAGYPVTVRNKL